MVDVNRFLMFIIVKVWFNWVDEREYEFVQVVKSEGVEKLGNNMRKGV